jgi:hypothetical protein
VSAYAWITAQLCGWQVTFVVGIRALDGRRGPLMIGRYPWGCLTREQQQHQPTRRPRELAASAHRSLHAGVR